MPPLFRFRPAHRFSISPFKQPINFTNPINTLIINFRQIRTSEKALIFTGVTAQIFGLSLRFAISILEGLIILAFRPFTQICKKAVALINLSYCLAVLFLSLFNLL